MTERQERGGGTGVSGGLQTHRLSKEAQNFLNALMERALSKLGEKLGSSTERLVERLENPGAKAALSGATKLAEGKSPLRAALSAGLTGIKEKFKKFFGKGKKALKLTNIVETLDVGAPIRLTYNQWTQFEDFPSFMKKVEHAERKNDGENVSWKAQIWWSHRAWETNIVEQVPDTHIVWRTSNAQKGRVDGAVSFSELASNLTRICLVMEYHPQGLFEHTGNLWRAQGRRARLEFKHFRRHVMVHAILNPDEIEGWRGEIREGEVVKSHEDALEEERAREEGEQPPEAEEGAEPEEGRAEAPEAEHEEAMEEGPSEAPELEEAEEEPEGAEEEPEGARTEEPEEAAEERGDTERLRRRRPPEGRERVRPPEDQHEDEEDEEDEDAREPAEPRDRQSGRPPRRRS
ncbi:MAG: integral rane protein-like protein [Streptosporangiaceae bacterium]|nr:integral rane protein-like protein [Streptosporangiaceae bacterium]